MLQDQGVIAVGGGDLFEEAPGLGEQLLGQGALVAAQADDVIAPAPLRRDDDLFEAVDLVEDFLAPAEDLKQRFGLALLDVLVLELGELGQTLVAGDLIPEGLDNCVLHNHSESGYVKDEDIKHKNGRFDRSLCFMLYVFTFSSLTTSPTGSSTPATCPNTPWAS